MLELKNTINTMVDQLNASPAEVTRVAKEVGTEGKLGGQADVKGVSRHLEGPHRQRELHGLQPDHPGARHRQGRDRGRERRPVARSSCVEAKGEIAALADTLNSMTKTLGIFAEQVTSVARTVGVEGQAGRAGRGARRRRHVEGPDRQRQPAGRTT